MKITSLASITLAILMIASANCQTTPVNDNASNAPVARHRHRSSSQRRRRTGLMKGITKKSSLRKDCCKNDGLCVLGSFCHCKPDSFGRYCQYKITHMYCGEIRHGDWARSGCNVCQCFNGVLTCVPQIFCDDGSGTKSKKYYFTSTTSKEVRVAVTASPSSSMSSPAGHYSLATLLLSLTLYHLCSIQTGHR